MAHRGRRSGPLFWDCFDTIYLPHGTFPIHPKLIDTISNATVDMMNGTYEPSMIEIYRMKVNFYDVGSSEVLWMLECCWIIKSMIIFI